MNESKSILTISRDQSLQSTRTFILEQEGYSVFAAVKDDDAVALVAANHNLSLVLMCHSVPEPSRVFLVNRINALNPKLPILILYNGYDITLAKVDGSLHSLESPQAMLEMISFMTKNIGTSAAVIYPEADRRTTPQPKSFKAGR
jgi:CheY-like chemotaxis protein